MIGLKVFYFFVICYVGIYLEIALGMHSLYIHELKQLAKYLRLWVLLTCGRLGKVWANKGLSKSTNKLRLYEALVMYTSLYVSEPWPSTVTNMKRLVAISSPPQMAKEDLDTTHQLEGIGHQWWSIRSQSGQQKLEVILRHRRLRWLHEKCLLYGRWTYTPGSGLDAEEGKKSSTKNVLAQHRGRGSIGSWWDEAAQL